MSGESERGKELNIDDFFLTCGRRSSGENGLTEGLTERIRMLIMKAIGGITGDAPAAGRGLAADGKFSGAAAHKKRKE